MESSLLIGQMEPMLLEDYKHGKAPKTLSNLIDFFKKNKITPNKNDILVGFLYILMLETGFIHRNNSSDVIEDCDFNYKRLLKYSKNLPLDWKKSDHDYHLDFVLKSAPGFICTLICLPISDDLLINCTIKDVAKFSLLLDPQQFFIMSQINLTIPMFQNLEVLARNFKNSIAFPAKISIISFNDGICTCLVHLPQELLNKIMLFLKVDDVMNLAQTCRKICQRTQDATLWLKLLRIDFSKKGVFKTPEELKFLYEIKYARELGKIMTKGPSIQ